MEHTTKDFYTRIPYLTILDNVRAGARRSLLIIKEHLKNAKVSTIQRKRAFSELCDRENPLDYVTDEGLFVELFQLGLLLILIYIR